MSTLFVDESKAKGYTMVAVAVATQHAPALRREMRALVLPGQRRIHFTNESDSRRRSILSTLDRIGVRAYVVHSDEAEVAAGRCSCLAAIVHVAASYGHERIVVERDETIERADRQTLYQEIERRGLRGSLHYAHEAAHHEPLLRAADALAWSHTKGGDWRRRIERMLVPDGLTR